MMQGESAVSERSVNKGRRGGPPPPCHAMDTRFGGRMHRGKKPGMSTPVPHATQPPPQHHDTVVDHVRQLLNGVQCSDGGNVEWVFVFIGAIKFNNKQELRKRKYVQEPLQSPRVDVTRGLMMRSRVAAVQLRRLRRRVARLQ